ncbi:FeoB-associated Cys-rich membrane protein [Streptomyces sp. NPDC046925]|uniref:FeoB-associated Cys-rich membrane protein n=1 Tax=Streptomyces sp. NPDC046925 TaxID=3155375 RepID=UPI003403A87D
MSWYTEIFRNQEMRQVDPFGYGVGLALGYVIIPALLVAIAVVIVWSLVKSRKEKRDV